jgi:hypothetical protein
MECGYAFYNYLWEIDTEGFFSNDVPETKRKRDLIASNLSTVELFLKFEYIVHDLSITAKAKDVYIKYSTFCTKRALRAETKINFNHSMESLGFQRKPIQGYDSYRVSIEVLKALSVRRKWMHVTDSDDNPGVFDSLNYECDEDEDQDPATDKLLSSFKNSDNKEEEFMNLLARFNKMKKHVTQIEKACEADDIVIPNMTNKKSIKEDEYSDYDDDTDTKNFDFYPYYLPTITVTVTPTQIKKELTKKAVKPKPKAKFVKIENDFDDDDADDILSSLANM